MPHIPFDPRSVNYAEYSFKSNQSFPFVISENGTPEANAPSHPSSAAESSSSYEYFDRKFRHNSIGMGNVRQPKRKKHLPAANRVEAKIEKPTAPIRLEGTAAAAAPLNGVAEKPKEAETGIGLLIKPPGAAAAAAGPIPISGEISKSFHSKKEKPSATAAKRKPQPPPSIKNNKIHSIVGRSAFKPSIIVTADNPSTSSTQALNKKRTKKDIFGIY